MKIDKQVIAIGGGGFGRNPGKGIIEKYILAQVSSKSPNICFIPTATGDDKSYIENFYLTFKKFKCNPTHLGFFERTPNLDELIFNQDIIFVGGGNTKSMLAVWREWQLDRILKKAYEKGIVMSGVSAGAICWFEKGITDSWQEKLNIIDCLGFVSGNCCPHYDEEPERKPSLTKFLGDKDLNDCFAIEGGCALHIKNNKVFTAISFEGKKNSYDVVVNNNKLEENILPAKDIL